MKSHLNQRLRLASKVTAESKEARVEVSSRCPMSVLSPASKKEVREAAAGTTSVQEES